MFTEPKIFSWTNSLAALFTGIIVLIITGTVLYPVVYVMFENFFNLNLFEPDPGFTGDDLIILITVYLWCFAAATAGGFTCAAIAHVFPWRHAWVIVLICCITLLILMRNDIQETDEFLLMAGADSMFLSGTMLGARLGIKYKAKREAEKNKPS